MKLPVNVQNVIEPFSTPENKSKNTFYNEINVHVDIYIDEFLVLTPSLIGVKSILTFRGGVEAVVNLTNFFFCL